MTRGKGAEDLVSGNGAQQTAPGEQDSEPSLFPNNRISHCWSFTIHNQKFTSLYKVFVTHTLKLKSI